MNAPLTRTSRIILVAITLGACASAFGGQEMLEVDSRFRAKIAKEKKDRKENSFVRATRRLVE